MAIKLFVDGNSTATVSDSNTTVIGASTGTQSIRIAAGVTGVTTDANVDSFTLPGNLSSYKFVAIAGTGTQVVDASGNVVSTIPSLNTASVPVTFADGTANMVQTGASSFTLGGQAIPTGTSATNAAAITSTAMGSNFSSTNTLSLTASATPINEGSAVTYTVTSGSVAPTGGLTIPYTLSGTATLTTDYTGASATTGNITIAAGTTTGTLTLTAVADNTTEAGAAETVVLTLGTLPTGYTLATGSTSTTTTSITDTSLTVTGSTFSLTTGFDNITGTTGNDTISGIGGTGATSSVGDSVDGGAGIDTFRIFSDGTMLLPTLTNVENLLINDTVHQDVNLSTTSMSSITGLTLQNGTTINATTVTVTLAANQALTLDAVTDGDDAAAVVGDGGISIAQASTITSTTLTLSDVGASTLNTALTIGIAGTGVTTLNLVATGTNNHVNLLNAGGVLATVNVSGAGNLTDWTALPATITSVNASSATGKLSFDGTGAVARSIVGGSGNDTISFTATDYIGAENATTTLRDTVNGGAGTDTLSLTIIDASEAAAATQTTATNFEVLSISDAWTTNTSFDATKFVGVTEVSLAAATAGSSTLTINSGTTVTLRGNSATDSTTSFTVGGVSGTDTVTLKMAGFDFLGANVETFTGVETLNINTGTAIADTAVFANNVTVTPSAGVTSKIVATGASALTFTGVLTTAEVDASALTGVLTVTGVPANAIKITGGTAADSIQGSAAADLLTGANGADTIRALGGDDSIILTETTSAADIVIFRTTAADNGSDTITGFTPGTDKINLDLFGGAAAITATGAATAYTAAADTVLFFSGGAAGDADSAAAAITFMNANSTYTDTANTFHVVVVDNNSTAVYQVTGSGGGNEFTGDTLTLIATVDAVLTTGDLLFAGG